MPEPQPEPQVPEGHMRCEFCWETFANPVELIYHDGTEILWICDRGVWTEPQLLATDTGPKTNAPPL